MIDKRTLNFFKSLTHINPYNSFFEPVGDLPKSTLDEMHVIAKSISIPERVRKKYRWYQDDHAGNLYSRDLCNINGVPAHDHYQRLFPNSKITEESIEWIPEFYPFRDALLPIGKKWRWVMLVRIDPLGWWGPHFNIPGPDDKDNYNLYWIPLNQVKNRFFGAANLGYFEPQLGKIYKQYGHTYEYSTINLGTESMYNLAGVAINKDNA